MILLKDEERPEMPCGLLPVPGDLLQVGVDAGGKAQLKKAKDELWAGFVKEDSPALLTLLEYSPTWQALLKEVE